MGLGLIGEVVIMRGISGNGWLLMEVAKTAFVGRGVVFERMWVGWEGQFVCVVFILVIIVEFEFLMHGFFFIE